MLAQLKLLKILQEDLNSRFRSTTSADDPASNADNELAEIATEQGRLAELALKLAQPPEANPEDDPESLPDVRQDRLEPVGEPGLDLPLEELLPKVEKEPGR